MALVTSLEIYRNAEEGDFCSAWMRREGLELALFVSEEKSLSY